MREPRVYGLALACLLLFSACLSLSLQSSSVLAATQERTSWTPQRLSGVSAPLPDADFPQLGPTVLQAGIRYVVTASALDGGGRTVSILPRSLVIGGTQHDGYKPVVKVPFSVDPKRLQGKTVTLRIGQIEGIHTPQSHRLGQASGGHISSPTLLKLNGHKLNYVYTNGEDMTVTVPRRMLSTNGLNILQIDAGYYFESNNTIAYDTVSVGDISLSF